MRSKPWEISDALLGAPAAGARVRLGDDGVATAADWQQAGVWEKLHALLLTELHAADRLEWERAVEDASHLQAKKGARKRVRRLVWKRGVKPINPTTPAVVTVS